MATYAIGDVQGCYRSLLSLLKLIHFQPQRDCLWFCGDLVNRGPDSLSVLRFIAELPNKKVVLGNHDLHLLTLAQNPDLPYRHTLHEILAAPDRDELLNWLRRQPLCIQQDNYYLAHAGFYPLWTLQEALVYAHELEAALHDDNYSQLLRNIYGNQPTCWDNQLTGWPRWRFITNAFTRMRFIDRTGNLQLDYKGVIGEQPTGFFPWFAHPHFAEFPASIIFGHWAALNGQTNKPNFYALDTGCVWGEKLTALRLEDRQRFAVDCVDIIN